MSGSVNGPRPVTLKSGDGIKSPPFAPSRVGKDEILYKTSSRALMLYFPSTLKIKKHSKVSSEFLSCECDV